MICKCYYVIVTFVLIYFYTIHLIKLIELYYLLNKNFKPQKNKLNEVVNILVVLLFAGIVSLMSFAPTAVCQEDDTNSFVSVALSQQSGTDIDSQYTYHGDSDEDGSDTENQEMAEQVEILFPDSTEAQIRAASLPLNLKPVVKNIYQAPLKSSM